MGDGETYFFTRLFWSDTAIIVSYISLGFAIATFFIARGLKKSLRIKARLTDLYRSLETDREKLRSKLLDVSHEKINYAEVDTIYSSLIGRLKATYEYLPKQIHTEIDSLIKRIEELNSKDFDSYFNTYTSFNSLITQIDEINKDNSWR